MKYYRVELLRNLIIGQIRSFKFLAQWWNKNNNTIICQNILTTTTTDVVAINNSSERRTKLPFFPSYESEVRGNVTVAWFPKQFSQSFFNAQQQECTSNACTLIAVLVASNWFYHNIKVSGSFLPIGRDIILAIAHGILEGNKIHETLLRRGVFKHVNLTVPEAIKGGGLATRHIIEWRCRLYMANMAKTFYTNLNEHICEWKKRPPTSNTSDLFVIVIADQRSVLIILQEWSNRIVLVDSHQHLSHGAVIAQVESDKLQSLCSWYIKMNMACYSAQPDCYELSFLYYEGCKK